MIPSEKSISSSEQKLSSTPKRLMRGVDTVLMYPIKHIKVEYGSGADKIDPSKQYILAVSHTTDLDVPIVVKALGDKLDLAITDQSTHHLPDREISMFYGLKASGSDNFIPISYKWDENSKKPLFNPSDVNPMIGAMKQGKSIVVAAHNPLDDGPKDKSEINPGYGAALLGLLSGAQIIPISVDIDKPDLLRRSNAHVTVGEPFYLDSEQDMSNIQTIMEKRKHGERLDPDEQHEFHRLAQVLRKSGRIVLDNVSRLTYDK